MNLSSFLAQRFAFDRSDQARLSRTMSRLGIISVALSTALMIISIAVLTGFKSQLQDKIIGFTAQLRISNYDSNESFETHSINKNLPFLDSLRTLPHIVHTQQYALKGGIIKANDEIQGVMMKGIGSDFDWSFFKQYLTEGNIFELNDSTSTNQVLISERMARSLQLKLGDKFEVYFVQDPIRVRQFTISGIFNTHFDEMDRTFLLCDIRHIRRLNGWTSEEVTGIEIFIDELSALNQTYTAVEDLVSYRTFVDGSRLMVSSLHDNFPQLFNWLAILDVNAIVILSLMLLVAGFNMVSGFLILILEKTALIGLLKALGMKNADVRKIFLYRSARLILWGLLWGNIFGISMCVIQQHFGIIKLDPESYYATVAPVQLELSDLLLLNLFSFIIILLIQYLPALFISNISPERTIRME